MNCEVTRSSALEMEYDLYCGKISLEKIGLLESFYKSRLQGDWSEEEIALQIDRLKKIASRYCSCRNKHLTIRLNSVKEEDRNKDIINIYCDPDGRFLKSDQGLTLAWALMQELIVDSIDIASNLVKKFPEEMDFLMHEARRLAKRVTIDSKPVRLRSGKFAIAPGSFAVMTNENTAPGVSLKSLALPREITIDLAIAKCNIACRFCQQAIVDVPRKIMDFAVFRKAVEAIPENVPIKTIMTPYTEPLLVKNYLPMLEYAICKRPVAEIGFNTNGVLLNAQRSEKLIDMKLKYISISLNMPDRDSYKWFHGRDFFGRVAQNIKTLFELKKAKKSIFPHIVVQFLKHPKIETKLDEATEYWKDFSDSVFIRNISVPKSSHEAQQELKALMEFDPYQDQIATLYPCPSPHYSLTLDVNGYYMPCCSAEALRSIAPDGCAAGDLVLGHVSEMSFAEAWQSEKLKKIRAWQMTGLLPTCRGCENRQANDSSLLMLKEGILRSCYGV